MTLLGCALQRMYFAAHSNVQYMKQNSEGKRSKVQPVCMQLNASERGIDMKTTTTKKKEKRQRNDERKKAKNANATAFLVDVDFNRRDGDE